MGLWVVGEGAISTTEVGAIVRTFCVLSQPLFLLGYCVKASSP